MKRRTFLKGLLGGAAAAVAAPVLSNTNNRKGVVARGINYDALHLENSSGRGDISPYSPVGKLHVKQAPGNV